MNELDTLVCKSCGTEGDVNISYSGSHVKAKCGSCLKYIKFISLSNVPSVRDLKLEIWELANKDLNKINELKFKFHYSEGNQRCVFFNILNELRKEKLQELKSNHA